MRKLSLEEIETVDENGTEIAKVEINGLNETDAIHYQILVRKCKFKPDSNHKNEPASDGYSSCYMIVLLNIVTIDGVNAEFMEQVRFFTQCTESEVFVHVGNYMGTVYMMNTLSDGYYLKNFDDSIKD